MDFFVEQDLLDRDRLKWFNANVYTKLNRLYRRKLYELHPDKMGSRGDTPAFMQVKQSWNTLKLVHEQPITIDLFEDDSDMAMTMTLRILKMKMIAMMEIMQ